MSLEDELTKELRGTVEIAKERGYVPTYFIRMLDQHGGRQAAKKLLATEEFQSGLTTLYELGLLEDSMERIVIKPKYEPLFEFDELQRARDRLSSLGYEIS